MTGLTDLDWPRRTARLTIRPAVASDAAACWGYNRRPEVAEWRDAPATDEATFTSRFVERIDGQLVAELDGRVVADLGVRTKVPYAQQGVAVPDDVVEADLGWAFDPVVQGRGLATEAVLELLAIAFDGLGARRVTADCFVVNEPSWRLMERIGMRREGHMVGDSLHRSGDWLDWYSYALLRSEWEARPADWAPPRARPSLAAVDWPRRTDRLLVRRATADDVPAVWAWSDDPRVSEWETAVHEDEASFAARWADPSRLPVRLVVEHDGAVVGELMLLVRDGEAQAEVEDVAAGCEGVLGWSFARAVHGRGLATEAAVDLVRVAFEELGLRRVTASCFADNIASWRLMERLGMRREQHVVGGALHRERGWVDGYEYALLADEWRAAPEAGPRT